MNKSNDAIEQERLEEAIEACNHAYSFIPEPKAFFEESMVIFSRIGEIHFAQKKFEDSFEDFCYAVKCKNGLGNPHIHMRLGQLQYHRGNMKRAADEFMRSYMGAGKTFFKHEDPKYFNLISKYIKD